LAAIAAHPYVNHTGTWNTHESNITSQITSKQYILNRIFKTVSNMNSMKVC